MRIIRLTAENFKKLRAVEITPAGNVVEITGRNGAGKTSVLDAIWAALGGTKHIQAVPIRKGADKARIRLDLGELVVERRFTPKGSALSVESADGARYNSPQNVLDKLLGALAFDPLEFVSQEASDQFETLRRLVPLEVDVDQLDALNRGDFERRTDLNREAKTLRAQAEGIAVPPDVPAEPVDTAALLQRMTDASRVNTEIESQRMQRGRDQDGIVDMRRQVGDARRRAEGLHGDAARLSNEADGLEANAHAIEVEADQRERRLLDAPPLPPSVDVDGLSRDLQQAQAVNKLVEARGRKAQFAGTAAEIEKQAGALTEAMDAREQVKAEAIAKAPMPVPGLGFGDGLVTFGGMPFDQASTAEQLRVSVAIAMAANPKLRVLRIKEGSLLDADGLALIADMAKQHDYQVWLEKVDSSGKVGIFIEDGQVISVDGEPTPQPDAKGQSPW